MIYVLTKSAKPFSRYEAINFKFPREKQNIVFLNVSIKLENNRIRDVIVDYFIMKKEIICQISVIWDTEVMTLFKQSVSKAYWKCNHKIVMVVMATKLEQNKFN